jgi:hypothetical protein
MQAMGDKWARAQVGKLVCSDAGSDGSEMESDAIKTVGRSVTR